MRSRRAEVETVLRWSMSMAEFVLQGVETQPFVLRGEIEFLQSSSAMIHEVPASSLVLDKPQGIGTDQDIEGEVKFRYHAV